MTATPKTACLQKQISNSVLEKNLLTINKKIAEFKKKIQLSEGQRKACFEENENHYKQNKEQINNLKKEIKKLTEEFVENRNKLGGEKEFRLVKYLHEIGSTDGKNHENIKSNLDLKVIDFHKQLDLMKYKKQKKKHHLDQLEKEYQTLLTEKSKTSSDPKKNHRMTKKAVSQLENDIHRLSVQLMEAEHIKKKYSGIRYSLLSDSIKYESTLIKVERMIKQQDEEITKLREINNIAMQMRDSTMNALLQHETKSADASGLREKQLIHFRNKVEDRKVELEKLERRIFPSARPMLVQQDSMGSGELMAVEEENASSLGVSNMDDIFYKLMKTVGVSDPECVFDKFKGQKATTERLLYLKNTMEEEKKNLESDQSLMMAEIEAHKFAQVKDKEENLEEMEDLKTKIDEELRKEKEYINEKIKIQNVLLDIKRCFYDCCLKLEDADDVNIPDWNDDVSNLNETLQVLKNKYNAAVILIREDKSMITVDTHLSPRIGEDRRKSQSAILVKEPSEEKNVLPTVYQELLAPRTKSRSGGTPSSTQAKTAAVSDDEDEIPSRGFLKRQAQLIIDTKSRRKGYRVPPIIKK